MFITPRTLYTVTVGAGGNRAYNNGTMTYSGANLATAGGNSSLGAIVSIGGGSGGSWTGQIASAGGSGGGRGGNSGGSPGTGIAGQGFSSVVLTGYGSYNETGGAGAGGVNTADGTGGVGISSSITGIPTFRAGGGGSGSHDNFTRSPGGNGGGGMGSRNLENNAVAGTDNTGGGGGGGGGNGNSVSFGANGGSGVVIIAYPISYAEIASISSSLNYSVDTTTRFGYRVYTFKSGTGTIQW
jgi:hypothetical protein